MNYKTSFSSAQKNMICRIFFVLKNNKSNAKQIFETLKKNDLPCYSPVTLYSCLKQLQMNGIVTCKIIRISKDDPEIITDYFSLSNRGEQLIDEFESEGFSHERKSKQLGKLFIILKCPKCNFYRFAHFPFKVIQCFNCDHKFCNANIFACSKDKQEALFLLKELKLMR